MLNKDIPLFGLCLMDLKAQVSQNFCRTTLANSYVDGPVIEARFPSLPSPTSAAGRQFACFRLRQERAYDLVFYNLIGVAACSRRTRRLRSRTQGRISSACPL